ncbi:ABC transporter ATP-binding protein [Pseudoramibacter alactolyticus]|uniref:ABC transporter ATP-binding protein n=1 Tax=Pseudoramibacter alactolyticus TaxID=113287 RepID=UPI00248D6211|nr:ABC transporter ATP-binding protein [Pseudoramibacter alactolyticus]
MNQKKSGSFFSDLKEFIVPYRTGYAMSVIISMTGVLCNMLSYATVGKIAGEIFAGEKELSNVIAMVMAAAILKILYGILINVSTWVSHGAAFKILRDIRFALSDKMLKLPLGYFEENGTGRLKTTLVDRVESVEKTLAHLLPEMTANILIPAAMIIWSFAIDWRVTLCMLIWFALGLALSGGMMKDYEERFKSYTNAEKNMNQAIVEYVGGIEVIKNFNRTASSFRRLEDAVIEHRKNSLSWQKDTLLYSTLTLSVAPFSVFPVLVSGFLFVSDGSLELSSLFLLILLALGVFSPVYKAVSYMDSFASMGTVAQEIREILDSKELVRGGEKISGAPDIRLEHVSFSYSEESPAALNDVSFHVQSGTMLALVGASGSGKSTIAKLMVGYWDKQAGRIDIGGRDINEYAQDELNKLIAYVDQETFLYNTSIMENIRVGRRDATDEEIIEAAKAAGCDDFIRALPEGYQTQAGMAGEMLSGGERQRIAIIRAMVKNAPIMIMDEATSSADPENEAAIQQAMSVSTKGKTLIVVAHRLNTIVHADQIAVIDKGCVIARGTHKELLNNVPEYRKMWEMSGNGEAVK